MNFESRQEAIYVAMMLARGEVDRLIQDAPRSLQSDLADVNRAIADVIKLLRRNVDPAEISILEHAPQPMRIDTVQ